MVEREKAGGPQQTAATARSRAEREARLAAAMRENLKRRKAQLRGLEGRRKGAENSENDTTEG